MFSSYLSFAKNFLFSHWKCILFTTIWIIGIGAGATALTRYAYAPGAEATVVQRWPTGSTIVKNATTPTLVVFAHPHCPCSAASVGELERLMPFLRDKVQVFVVFTQPKGRSLAWVRSPLWERVNAIPGTIATIDTNYTETDLFGAKTSGQVFFYDHKETLIFSGGITPARGHMGDSQGRDIILSWLQGKTIKPQVANVFGCALKEAVPVSRVQLEKQ